MKRYLIIIEGTDAGGFSAYSPDVPGCIATGRTRAVVKRRMREALEFHLEGLAEAGDPIPRPSVTGAYVEVAA